MPDSRPSKQKKRPPRRGGGERAARGAGWPYTSSRGRGRQREGFCSMFLRSVLRGSSQHSGPVFFAGRQPLRSNRGEIDAPTFALRLWPLVRYQREGQEHLHRPLRSCSPITAAGGHQKNIASEAIIADRHLFVNSHSICYNK